MFWIYLVVIVVLINIALHWVKNIHVKKWEIEREMWAADFRIFTTNKETREFDINGWFEPFNFLGFSLTLYGFGFSIAWDYGEDTGYRILKDKNYDN